MSMTASLHETARLAALLKLELPQRIFTTIADAGGEARFVGGVVRDALTARGVETSGEKITDLDMAMTLTPDAATTVLTAAGLRVLPTGIDHGTITVFDRRDDRVKVELTTLRQDLDTDGRHAVVEFSQDWAADAARRDFTFNSMYLAADGTLFDPFDGRADLAAGRVRFIGDAATRLKEDYLRMLRFFRFQARFGTTAPDPMALSAIADAKPHLARISGERIARELAGLVAPGPSSGLMAMVDTGVDKMIVTEGFWLARFEKLSAIGHDVPLAAAYTALVDDHDALARRLKSSGKLRAEMAYLAAQMTGRFSTEDWPQKAWAEQPAGAIAPMMLAWRYAVQMVKAGAALEQNMFDRLMAWQAPEFPLQGRHLMALGVAPGAEMGMMLKNAEAQWVDSGFALSREDLLAGIGTKKLDAGGAKS